MACCKVSKKCEHSHTLVYSGFDSHRFHYMQKVHTNVRTSAILRKTITMCRRLNISLIKQMLIYVCYLSVVLCHRRWLVDLIFFDRSRLADTLLHL
jgi:hypothetical protein